MAKLVVDCSVVLRLAAAEVKVSAKHKLLAPTLLRSQTLSALHEAVYAGKLSPEAARERLACRSASWRRHAAPPRVADR
jgi:hypothetical protein